MSENLKSGTVHDKGSWQAALSESAKLFDRADGNRQKASALLWQGGRSAIAEWLEDSDSDVEGTGLYDEVIGLMGANRKGDASKIKSVAIAARDKGLDINEFENLSRAYAEANRLTKTAKVHKAEDEAIEAAVEAVAEAAPGTTKTVEGAAQILFSKGLSGAVVAILDVLNGPSGAQNFDAHRAFIREVQTELASRVTAAAQAEAEAKKQKVSAERAKAKEEREAEQAAKKEAAAKEREAKKAEREANKPAKAPATKPAAKAKPVKRAQPKPKTKAEEPVEETEPIEVEVDDLDAMLDEGFDTETGEGFTESQQAAADTLNEMAEDKGVEPVAKPRLKGRPVVRR